jgi:exosortase family protein XrtF
MSVDFRRFITNPLVLFLIKALVLFFSWIIAYELWLNPIGTIDLFVIDKLIIQSAYFLELFGYELIPDSIYDTQYRTIGLDGTHGVWVGDSCNGLTVFALFTGFIIAFPGKWIRKLGFISFGIITIHLLNIIRVAALCIILLESPESLDFNHTYVFTTIIYAYIFLLWYWWANKLSFAKL